MDLDKPFINTDDWISFNYSIVNHSVQTDLSRNQWKHELNDAVLGNPEKKV